ncbi:hypothetical protein NVP2058O_135 [Vibrio phage 2.058.O._10N.286.46.B8]|nr:hypothetical protein NVP2058O_135 [Vibrio phage 2.058.O._10N.286.46.B8]
MKRNFIKTEKKNRKYSDEQLDKIERSKHKGKQKRGRAPVEFE